MATPEPIFDLRRGDSPLLISMPHSGTYVPPDILKRITPAARPLPDTDWHIPELYAFLQDFDVSVVTARYNRYVVDLNRPPGNEPLYSGRSVSGLCPLQTFSGDVIYENGQAPDHAEVNDRIRTYWEPYHAALAGEIERISGKHDYCVLYDAHSIRSTVPALFTGKLPDLNLGTNHGQSCDKSLQDAVEQELCRHKDFSQVSNGRFIGGYITRHYGQPSGQVHALQMEIGQDAYLAETEPPLYHDESAANLVGVLQELFEVIAGWKPAES